jgi:hypothetical protein
MPSKEWRHNNPERHREHVRRAKQKARAVMTVEEKRAQRVKWEQNKFTKLGATSLRPDKCEVCGSDDKVVFDHCHVNNKFRGWLCNGCNSALGHAKDNPDTLRKLAEYLEIF